LGSEDGTVVPTLIESQRKTDKKRFLGVGFVSFTMHAAVIAGAVFATLHATARDTQVRVDTTMVLLAQDAQRAKPPEQQPVQLDVPLKGFQTVVVPAEIPSNVPPVDLQEHFDPKDYSGAGVEGGHASGVAPSADQVYVESMLEQRPALLSGPPPYPPLLRDAGIQGRVVLQAIIDTLGRIEPSSIKILQTTTHGFEQSSTAWALAALFRPARLQGRAVRALVRFPLDYSVTP
jgi:outer membrane biosynthesis protein TonB